VGFFSSYNVFWEVLIFLKTECDVHFAHRASEPTRPRLHPGPPAESELFAGIRYPDLIELPVVDEGKTFVVESQKPLHVAPVLLPAIAPAEDNAGTTIKSGKDTLHSANPKEKNSNAVSIQI
jgi:hypothetical protein